MMELLLPALPTFGKLVLLALTVWREARNESYTAKLAVAYVVMTRVEHPSWWGHDVESVLFAPMQFSSMTDPHDPQLTRWPHALRDAPAWNDCLKAAASALFKQEPNPAPNATHYFSPPIEKPPTAWGDVEHVADYGRLHFYHLLTSRGAGANHA